MQELRNIEQHVLWYARPGIETQRSATLMLDRDNDSLEIELFPPSTSLSETDLQNLSTIAARIVLIAGQFCGGVACVDELKKSLPQCFFLSRIGGTVGLVSSISHKEDAPIVKPSVNHARSAHLKLKRAGARIPRMNRTTALVTASMCATVLVCLSYSFSRRVASEHVKMVADVRANVRSPSPGTNHTAGLAVASIEAQPELFTIRAVSKRRRMTRSRVHSRGHGVMSARQYVPTSHWQPLPEVRLLSAPELPIVQGAVELPTIVTMEEVPPAPDRNFGAKVAQAIFLPLKKLGGWLQ